MKNNNNTNKEQNKKEISEIIKEDTKNIFQNKNSEEFDRQRKIANLQILDIIKTEIENNDSLRFMQILWALHIIDRNINGIIDRFYEEPQETLKRIKKWFTLERIRNMTIELSQQDKEDLILIQPYYSQKQQSKVIGVSINSMMKLREQAGLPAKEKGRPKGTGIVFKDEQKIPTVIIDAGNRLNRSIRIQKLYTSLREQEDLQKQFKLDLQDKSIEEIEEIITKYKDIKERNEQSRIKELVTE